VGESLAFLAGRGEGEVGESEDMLRDLWSSENEKESLYRPIFFIFEFWRRI
jgi:alpha-mannosidase